MIERIVRNETIFWKTYFYVQNIYTYDKLVVFCQLLDLQLIKILHMHIIKKMLHDPLDSHLQGNPDIVFVENEADPLRPIPSISSEFSQQIHGGFDQNMTTFTVVLTGGSPWGFRLQGGREFNEPVRIAKVSSFLFVLSKSERYIHNFAHKSVFLSLSIAPDLTVAPLLPGRYKGTHGNRLSLSHTSLLLNTIKTVINK